MKFLSFILMLMLSTSGNAECYDSETASHTPSPRDIALSYTDTPVSEVIEYINLKCHEFMEPLQADKPNALISLEFEQIRCENAAAVINDFDS